MFLFTINTAGLTRVFVPKVSEDRKDKKWLIHQQAHEKIWKHNIGPIGTILFWSETSFEIFLNVKMLSEWGISS